MVQTLSHPQIENGWFTEKEVLWKGQKMSLEVKQIVHCETSKYQDVLIFDSASYGRVLVLDGAIQVTERDEFSYQEMITHIPLNCHPDPKKILIIGGGDGGVVREVLKHKTVEEIVLCDIDEYVIRLSKQYLPSLSCGLKDSKVTVHVGDGFDFLKNNTGAFDVIITDSSDPVGPAESLYKMPYYQLLKNSLREGGIICAQGECMWLDLDFIKKIMDYSQEIFPVVDYAYTTIPTYPCGQIGFLLCSLDHNMDFKTPVRRDYDEVEDEKYKYYHYEMHKAAFVLPKFVKKALDL